MADEVEISGSGTRERVAYDLTRLILHHTRNTETYASKDEVLDLYAECRVAAAGHRKMRT